MHSALTRSFYLLPVTLLAAGCALTSHRPDPTTSTMAMQTIAASDPRFLYEGRFDLSSTDAPVVIWQASRIRIDFQGDQVGLLFDQARDQNYFNARIDKSNRLVSVQPNNNGSPLQLSGCGSGRHHLVLFKRSEASAGTARFRGIELPAGMKAWQPSPPKYKTRMLFIGDSITAGACDEDGPSDQWENRSTHNNAMSYGALAAPAFNADYRNISVSGMGVATGWSPVKAGEIWDRLYPDPKSPRANLTNWIPDFVFVNLGENDDSFPRAHNQSFPTNFTSAYVSLVHSIRSAYPAARIVLLRGGMFGGANSKELRGAWDSAVKQLQSADPRITHFVFNHWSNLHPRIPDHQAMAEELVMWVVLNPL